MMKRLFAAAAIATSGAVLAAGGAANAAYINPATNKIESSNGGDITVVFDSSWAGDSSNLVSVNTGATLFNNHADSFGTTVNIGSFLPGEEIDFRLDNLSKSLSFVTGLAADNYDNVLHAILSQNADGSITVGFEDLPNGGDLDYNDLVFTVYETAFETPIPAAGVLLLTGLAGFGFAGRKRKAARA
ncbi:DUF4114 domain-containing protein [Hyphococcus luteus]|uniref:DUF4114 domain-containing protein n=1 Tax=Hyphococcus luteus TaxID=2058213 RepID=A0A2S7K3H5_9PROT|nr:DUF4114 domain-containing protein [Marinicaulis flavus]PQA87049.1 hypothetical protein CW354_13440 [Marinicaulis flavus]